MAGSVAINVVNEDTRAQFSGSATLAGADSGGSLQAITQLYAHAPLYDDTAINALEQPSAISPEV